MSQFHHRLICALAVISLSAPSAAIALPADSAGGHGSVRIDCRAFKRTSETSWVVTAPTTVPSGGNLNSTAGSASALPRGATVKPLYYHVDGVDLATALNRQCGK